MHTKQVFQTDMDGYWIGMTTAFESPLEPGVFHLPAGCIETPAPQPAPGQRVRWCDSEWIVESEEIVEPTPPTPEELAISKRLLIDRMYEQAIAPLWDDYPNSEISGWPQQLEEARRYLGEPSSTESDYPLLSNLARHNETSLVDMARRVARKADQFAVFYGELTGLRHSLRSRLDAIELHSDQAEEHIAAIDENELPALARSIQAALAAQGEVVDGDGALARIKTVFNFLREKF